MNAIERLRAEVESPKFRREDAADWESAADALAAVDALYQAAKRLEDYFTELDDYSISLSDGLVEDLRDSIVEIARAVAAVVRRIEGTP